LRRARAAAYRGRDRQRRGRREAPPREEVVVKGRHGTSILLAGATLVVGLVVGLAVGLLVDRSTTQDAVVPGALPESTTVMVDAWIAATRNGDAAQIASFYAPDAVFMEFDREPAVITDTATGIGRHVSGYIRAMGADVSSAGPAVSFGSVIAQPMQTGGGRGAIQVIELDETGLITRQWALGPVMTPGWRESGQSATPSSSGSR
jgi:hypothetical protein